MTIYKIERKPQKSLKELERDAIAFANQGRWDAAAEANQEALALSADNVEALNRLGRALSELGRYTDARATFQRVLRLSRNNPIARKNLERIASLQDAPASKPVSGLAPRLFLKESGKTCLTDVTALGGARQLSRLAPGETLALERSEGAVVVRVPKGEVIGRLSPKLAARLARLLQGGNRYAVGVAALADGRVTVLIREVYQHPSLIGVVSFPSSAEGADTYADDVEVVEEEGPEPEPGAAPGAWPAAQAVDEKEREGDGEAEERGVAARSPGNDDEEDDEEDEK